MKSDFVFALENSTWPALVLGDSGVIHRANAAAVQTFGGVSETGGASAASIWSPENESSIEIFLSRVERSGAAGSLVKLRTKGGQTVGFQVYVAAFAKDGQKLYLMQLHKPGATA